MAGQWAWLLLSPLDDLFNHCTLRQLADLQREGWQDTGNDDRRGGVVVVVREVCLHTPSPRPPCCTCRTLAAV